ncbi:MAG: hypothetical protein ABI569_11825 [Casimicrobiaceae bacterium]
MPHENLAGVATLTTQIDVRAAPKSRPAAPRASRTTRQRPGGRELLFLALVAGLLAVAIVVARSGLFTAGSDIGYWIGVAGGVAMLLLFLYPLRKRWRPLREIGTTRFWFSFHMMLGIAGPLLIIVHSTLAFGSLNATVAFTAMALVAASGIAGRFLYSRIHHGLYGRRANLAELRAHAGLDSEAVRSKLSHAPVVKARLDEFARLAVATGRDGLGHPLRFMALGWHAKVARRRCTVDVVRALREHADVERWSPEKLAHRIRSRRALIAAHLVEVQRVAQFGVFERLFSWWHVLHVPLVYMMVLAAIAHVVAVHMY